MCERKARKDAPAAVVSRAACVSRALSADASRPALSGWAGLLGLFVSTSFNHLFRLKACTMSLERDRKVYYKTTTNRGKKRL